MALLERVIAAAGNLYLLWAALPVAPQSLLHDGSEEVTVEQEPILAAGGAARISVQKGPVAPWL